MHLKMIINIGFLWMTVVMSHTVFATEKCTVKFLHFKRRILSSNDNEKYTKLLKLRCGSISKTGVENCLKSFAAVISNPTVTGGVLSGGLHAITGPDHLAAVVPSSIGKSGWYGVHVGAVWGLGHGLSAITLGMCAYFMKGRLLTDVKLMHLRVFSLLAESAVGLSLLFIGLMGVKEYLSDVEVANHSVTLNEGSISVISGSSGDSSSDTNSDSSRSVPENADSVAVSATTNSKSTMTAQPSKYASSYKMYQASKTLFVNGLLHGLSWDGAPSLAPAIAMATWQGALGFLMAYALGTMLAMSITAGTVGELSKRMGRVARNANLSRQLSLVSSCAAVGIGLCWTVKALL